MFIQPLIEITFHFFFSSFVHIAPSIFVLVLSTDDDVVFIVVIVVSVILLFPSFKRSLKNDYDRKVKTKTTEKNVCAFYIEDTREIDRKRGAIKMFEKSWAQAPDKIMPQIYLCIYIFIWCDYRFVGFRTNNLWCCHTNVHGSRTSVTMAVVVISHSLQCCRSHTIQISLRFFCIWSDGHSSTCTLFLSHTHKISFQSYTLFQHRIACYACLPCVYICI